MKTKLTDILLVIMLGVIIVAGTYYIRQHANAIDVAIEYKRDMQKLDIKLDSINNLLITNSNERSIFYNKLDSLNNTKTITHETFQKNYNNIIIGTVSDDSITKYIANKIYNWQRYTDSIQQVRK